MRVNHEAAFVLHQRNYSETSLLVELFSHEYGRLTVLAKGARRPSSPFRGLLKPFQPLLTGWVGRTDLPILTQAEASGPSLLPAGPAIYCGFYLNELLCRLLHRHDPHLPLYDSYASTLEAISVNPMLEQPLRYFELQLLRDLGYGPVLDRDIGSGDPVVAGTVYDYLPDRGPVAVVPNASSATPRGLRLMGETLLGLAQCQLDTPDSLRESKRLMRMLLAVHLGMEPLHSRMLMQRVLAAKGMSEQNELTDMDQPCESTCGSPRTDD